MGILGDREPFGTREGAVIRALRAALAPGSAAYVRINSAEPDETGRCLSDEFVTRATILEALQRLVNEYPRQAAIVVLRYGHGLTKVRTSKRVRWDENTVARDEFAALQQLVRWCFDDPTYESPLRLRRLLTDDERAWLRLPEPKCG